MSVATERRLAHAAKLSRKAGALGAVAAGHRAACDRIAGAIPMGQPILVGHHSEGKHRRDIAKAQASMARSVEAHQAAERARETSDALVRNVDNAPIRATDSDAVEALKVKLADAEAFAEKARATVKAQRAAGNDCAYLSTNAAARVRSIKKRIAEIEAAAAKPPVADERFGDAEVRDEDGHTRIVFPGKPDESTRAALKSRGFRWSPSAGAWQRQATNAAREAARSILGGRS